MKQLTSLQYVPLESNGIIISYNDEFCVQKRSLFHQDDHLISCFLDSRDSYVDNFFKYVCLLSDPAKLYAFCEVYEWYGT